MEPKIVQGNVIGKLIAEKKPPAFIIENLYVRCLSRPPTEVETRKLVAAVEAREVLAHAEFRQLGDGDFLRHCIGDLRDNAGAMAFGVAVNCAVGKRARDRIVGYGFQYLSRAS